MTDAVRANDADLATSQRKGVETATAQRNTTHKHRPMWMRVIVTLVILLFVKDIMEWGSPVYKAWRAEAAKEEVAETAARQKARTSNTYQPRVTTHEVVWSESKKDGSIPTNQWSEVVVIGLGCKIDFSLGDGREAEYQYYSKEWKRYRTGTSPNMSHLRFMVTVDGVTSVPYTTSCK